MPDKNDIICLLDDEPSVLKALGRLLSSDGLKAEKFSDPALFLNYARSHSVQLAVIDIRMPGMTGLEVLEALQMTSSQVRVIIITGEGDIAHRSAALVGGARAFFLKPFDDEQFLRAVREALLPMPQDHQSGLSERLP